MKHASKGGARGARRAIYTEAQKQLVRERYQFCTTREEKQELADQLGMRSLEQLYNLANRLGITRPQQELILTHGSEREHEAFDTARLRLREDPARIHFSGEDDTYLRDHFGSRYLEQIAFHRNHTESAMLYRARHLGLRSFCKYFDADKVCGWLNLDPDLLDRLGVDFYPCRDRTGEVQITLVSTSSLLRIIADDKRRVILEQADADRFFLAELDELLVALRRHQAEWESSRWVSHGHTCLNPYSGISFGLFDDGTDKKMLGRELHPADIAAGPAERLLDS